VTTHDRPGLPAWACLLFLGVGIVFLAVAIAWTTSVNAFLATARTATGQIVDVHSRRDDDGQWMHRPVIRFTVDGKEHEVAGAVATSWKPEVGAQVDVLYDPAHPDDANLAGFWSQWLGPVIFYGLGVVLTVVGGLLFVFRRSLKPVAAGNVDLLSDRRF